MGTGFQSIEDLMQGGKGGAQTPSSGVQKKVEEKFEKKMAEISEKAHEVQAQKLAAQTGTPHIDLEHFPVSQNALRQLPIARAKELQAVCFYAAQEELRIGAIDPSNAAVREMVQELANHAQANAALYTISERSFDHVIDLYKTLPDIKEITKDINIDPAKLKQIQAAVTDLDSFQKILAESSTTDLVAYIFGGGLKLGASDVHIEAEEGGIMVRFRLDGMLQDAAEVPREAYKKLVSRIKLVAGLKINITEQPQDGRFSIILPEGVVDVRVSTIPTVYGESIVMRLLVQHKEQITLEKLGLRGRAFEQLQREIQRPNGMIITTGPTGSGKTTTLYAIMHVLNNPDVKIITLEDPVEYKMDGINQSQIDKSKDYTFAKGLRSMMRQDPDIAMVGEIRDLETAEIAIQAALTGHLMLSTIHTNDSFGTIPRFLSMGVKPFLLAPALNAVIGQRLVRRLCEHCKKPGELTPEMKQRVDAAIAELPTAESEDVKGKELNFMVPGGCEKCNDLGYKGRLGIYEIFVINEEIEKSILEGNVAEYDIRRIAIEHGTVTMVQDGILKALDGLTSVEEVFRVTE